MSAAILVVAAEPALGAVLEQVLGQAGIGPVETATPEQALEVVASSKPRLVVLDLETPADGDAASGIDLLATLAPWVAGDPPLPVIAVAAASAADSRRRARAAGARDFLAKPLDPTEVLARVQNVLAASQLHTQGGEASVELEQTRLESVERLARLAEYRDDATYEHPQRVGRTSSLLADRLGLAPEVVRAIRSAAPLHDVGKVGVPDRILLKPGRLTAAEFELMKSHTLIGAEILAGSTWPVLQLAEEIAISHHERWDGTGYPDGKVEEEIPMSGRIVIVADNFDALTHSRPYAQAWDPEKAAAEIRRQSGQHFDPEVVEAFGSLDLEFLLSPMV
ncbi:MAG: cyclic di-GMP phosphodiesterase [Thermoleophilaceae bacterium]|nr:cyclic di-GMP phosphodiesterase [Thermoleophilaceae bacterium]